jgi:hypothetical protein
MLKQITTAAAALLIAMPGMAETAPKTGTWEDHQRLWLAIASTGTVVKINSPTCFEDDAPMGYYAYNDKGNSEFVVCQENAKNSTEVDWTNEDLDTLRHEAVHLIQDCADGVRADGRLSPLGSSQEILALVDRSIGRARAQRIIEVYRSNGLESASGLMSEVEAFSAADSVSAATLSEMVFEACAAG